MAKKNKYIQENGAWDTRRLYVDAIQQFGSFNQLVVASEEAGELVQALSKIIRYADNEQELERARDHAAEEIADVLIMCSQLGLILNVENDVLTWMDKKLDRLVKRLEKAKKKNDIQATSIPESGDQ